MTILNCVSGKILTNEMVKELMKLHEHNKKENCSNCINAYLYKLPAITKEILYRIFIHFNRVSKNSDINKMDLNNLCIVFAPSLSGMLNYKNFNKKKFDTYLEILNFIANNPDVLIKPPEKCKVTGFIGSRFSLFIDENSTKFTRKISHSRSRQQKYLEDEINRFTYNIPPVPKKT
ncbi:hypothetical protein MXB_2569 [Myxobolus squamalis]|nr:hypothetical protein MXB_2569 [Myxobolus squamalis]